MEISNRSLSGRKWVGVSRPGLLGDSPHPIQLDLALGTIPENSFTPDVRPGGHRIPMPSLGGLQGSMAYLWGFQAKTRVGEEEIVARNNPAFGGMPAPAGACRDGQNRGEGSQSIRNARLAPRRVVTHPQIRFDSGLLPASQWV